MYWFHFRWLRALIKAKVNDSKIRKNKSKDGKKEPPGVGGLRKGFFDQSEVCNQDCPFLTNRKDGLAKLYFIVISCTDQLFFLRDDLLWGKNGGVFIDQRNQLVIYDLVYGSGVRF